MKIYQEEKQEFQNKLYYFDTIGKRYGLIQEFVKIGVL